MEHEEGSMTSLRVEPDEYQQSLLYNSDNIMSVYELLSNSDATKYMQGQVSYSPEKTWDQIVQLGFVTDASDLKPTNQPTNRVYRICTDCPEVRLTCDGHASVCYCPFIV